MIRAVLYGGPLDDPLDDMTTDQLADACAAAVAAHLASDAVIERMARGLLDAIKAEDGGAMIAHTGEWTGIDCVVRVETVARAAVAAVVGEAGNDVDR